MISAGVEGSLDGSVAAGAGGGTASAGFGGVSSAMARRRAQEVELVKGLFATFLQCTLVRLHAITSLSRRRRRSITALGRRRWRSSRRSTSRSRLLLRRQLVEIGLERVALDGAEVGSNFESRQGALLLLRLTVTLEGRRRWSRLFLGGRRSNNAL